MVSMLSAYSVSMTKSDIVGRVLRLNPSKSVSTKLRVISRARSARKFIKTTESPSLTVTNASLSAVINVGLTNSSEKLLP